MNKDISLLSIKEENEQSSNELKNPYLKKDDIPELEFIGKNNIISINFDGYHENFQESKSFNATNLFNQEDDKKSQSNQ